jgi:outer membrane protein TolC
MIGRILQRTLTILVFAMLCVTKAAGTDITPQSISFSEAADLAVSASADLRAEHKGLKILENAWVLGFRNYLPKFSLSAQENDRLQVIGSDSFVKNYSINMDQLLWDGGKLSMSRRLEKTELNLANARLERMASDIAESAVFAYYSVLRMRTILAIKEAAVEFLSGQISILEKEVELGLALAVDLAEAELALAEARIEIISIESDLGEFERQFAELLGFEELPTLSESIEINRDVVLPPARASVSLAEEKNPELVEARFSIVKRRAEYKAASRSWIPTFRIVGSFGLTGTEYPLTRHTWSVGLNIDFATPWLQNTFAFQYGRESPRDQTSAIQNNLSPLPNPAASLGRRQAGLALDYEREKYSLAFGRTGRAVESAIEKCRLADRRRRLAVEAAEIASRRYGLEELRLGLGHITRLELMEAHIEFTAKEIMTVDTALGQMQAERELEKLLDLKPGELEAFARSSLNFSTR